MSTKRSEGWKPIRRTPDGYAYCKNDCGKVCDSKRRLYCSNECSEDYAIKNFSAYARARVFERDHGVCALCHTDTLAFVAHLRAACQRERDYAYGRIPGPNDALEDWRAEYQRFYGSRAPHYWSGVYLRTPWEMDHIVPVIEGGGQCGLDGLRTLCLPCHREQTRLLRLRMSIRRQNGIRLDLMQKHPGLTLPLLDESSGQVIPIPGVIADGQFPLFKESA